MTGGAPATCWATSASDKSCSQTAPMTATRSAAARGAWANVKPMPRRVNIPSFSPFLYRYRNLVERFFGKIKHFRAVATRFEKHDANYLAIVKLVAARIWMRFMSR
jgi:transposase